VIEDLNVKGMVRNHHLAKSISDAGFGEFRRQLTHKAPEYGVDLVVAERWFPSSKTCSVCGHKLDKLALSVRQWTCPICGTVHHRDINASVNLRNIGVTHTLTACGEFSASDTALPYQATSVKQEKPDTFVSIKEA
jgi:putative transposase